MGNGRPMGGNRTCQERDIHEFEHLNFYFVNVREPLTVLKEWKV